MARQNVILLGIDEAGYGPVLGPLTVSAVGVEVPRDRAESDLWALLKQSVRPSAAGRDARIAICDSKKLYSRSDGLKRLERSVLAVARAHVGMPATIRALLQRLCPEVGRAIDHSQWYAGVDASLPLAADAGGIRIAARRLADDLEANASRIAGVWSEVLLERAYNKLVERIDNKAVVLLGLTLRLVQRVADEFPEHDLHIHIDKQGGRSHYVSALRRAFEDRRLRVIDEGAEASAYELVGSQSCWRISFRQSGESHHLTTALASLFSKYQRELLMHCFNAYWTAQVPGLRPTAGYYQDGHRFLREIDSHLPRLGIARENLMRSR